MYVAEGLFDVGITGRDWIEETASEVVSLGELRYSKATSDPIKIVVAVAGDSPVTSVEEIERRRACVVGVSRADPALLRRARASPPTCGSATAPARPRSPTSPTAWSRSPRPGGRCAPPGCKVIDTILVSYTEVIANPAPHADPVKRHAMGQLMTLLNGALDARGKVLLKLNVSAERYEDVLAVLPVGEVADGVQLAGGGYAVESVVEKRTINLIIPALREAGATDLLEIPISKIVP